jgi:hypothetical protein
MTVKELIEELQAMDPTKLVVMSSDAEGNKYSPLEGADDARLYVAETTWSGEVYDAEDQDDDEEDLSEAVPCVVLFPVN